MFATPFLVALMEEACRNAVESHLPEGKITLGAQIDLKHMAPTPLGFEIRASACLVEAKGPKLVFEVGVVDEKERVGEGRHVRYHRSVPAGLDEEIRRWLGEPAQRPLPARVRRPGDLDPHLL